MAKLTIAHDEDGIAVISWHYDHEPLRFDDFTSLESLVNDCVADDHVHGIVMKVDTQVFNGSLDFKTMQKFTDEFLPRPPEVMYQAVLNFSQSLRHIERAGMDRKNEGGKPIAAVLHGNTIGLGLSVAMACHRVFVSDDPHIRIGHPEILMGLIPGGGTSQRVVRKIGLIQAAAPLMEARMYSPERAAKLGLVDETAPSDELMDRAKKWVLSKPDFVKPWDKAGFRAPAGGPYSAAGYGAFVSASAVITSKTRAAYQAANVLVSAIYEGMLAPFDIALQVEARWFAHQLRDTSTAAILRAATVNRKSLEARYSSAELEDTHVNRLGVVGSGMIGGSLAVLAGRTGIPVTLIDRDLESAETGKEFALLSMARSGALDNLSPAQRDALAGRITATDDFGALADCDLVLEAVVEEPRIKEQVIKRIESVIHPNTVLASSTQTLQITELAQASSRPSQLVGFHCFAPVDRVGLVEVVSGEKTGERAVTKALRFATLLKKTPIMVKDTQFFFVNRCIIPFINEGMRMIGEGVVPPLVDNAARRLGFPAGPLNMVDRFSLSLASRILRSKRRLMGDAFDEEPVEEVVHWMLAQDRRGRSFKAGFYNYTEDGHRNGLWAAIGRRFKNAGGHPELKEVQDRLMLVQVLEALRACDQGVLERFEDGDVAATLGWGFAPWTGGPFNWIDHVGPARVAERAQELQDRYGPRFAPPPLLFELAERGGVYAHLRKAS